jgi:hypothetical protein
MGSTQQNNTPADDSRHHNAAAQQHLRTASGHIVDPASESSLAHARRMLFMTTADDSGDNTSTVESSSVSRQQAPADSDESQVLQAPDALIHVDSLSARLAGSWQIQRVVYILLQTPVVPKLVAHRRTVVVVYRLLFVVAFYCCCSRVCVFRIINLTNPSAVIFLSLVRFDHFYF